MSKPKTLSLEHRGEKYTLTLEPYIDEKLSFQYLYISNENGGVTSKLIPLIDEVEVKYTASKLIDEHLKTTL